MASREYPSLDGRQDAGACRMITSMGRIGEHPGLASNQFIVTAGNSGTATHYTGYSAIGSPQFGSVDPFVVENLQIRACFGYGTVGNLENTMRLVLSTAAGGVPDTTVFTRLEFTDASSVFRSFVRTSANLVTAGGTSRTWDWYLSGDELFAPSGTYIMTLIV